MTKQNLIAIAVLLILDLLWIYIYMGSQYSSLVQDIQGSEMVVTPWMGALAYLLMVIGLVVFVLPRIRKGHEWEDSLRYGFTFGIVLYGVYDFTAGAVLKNWDRKLAVVDVLWGGIVYLTAAYTGSIIANTWQ